MEENLLLDVERHIRETSDECGDYLRMLSGRPHMIQVGLITWSPGEAYRWAGPFAEGRVLALLYDGRKSYPGKLASIETLVAPGIRRIEADLDRFPLRLRDQPRLRHDRQALHNAMTEQEQDKWRCGVEKAVAALRLEYGAYPHSERPFRLHLTGNDDCSWSACFESREDARQALARLLASPNFATLDSLGFAFTN